MNSTLHFAKKITVFLTKETFYSKTYSRYSTAEKKAFKDRIQVGESAAIVSVSFPFRSELAIIAQAYALGFCIRSKNGIKYFFNRPVEGLTHGA
jgi:hypothetical protein